MGSRSRRLGAGEILLTSMDKDGTKSGFDLEMLNEKGKLDVDSIRKLHQYHCIILAANETGRINLYRLISASHLTYSAVFRKFRKVLSTNTVTG